MAVTIHHRNPSGFRNKVKWLLSESKWDSNKIIEIMTSVDCLSNELESINSWYKADALAQLIANGNFDKAKRLFPEYTIWIEDKFENRRNL